MSRRIDVFRGPRGGSFGRARGSFGRSSGRALRWELQWEPMCGSLWSGPPVGASVVPFGGSFSGGPSEALWSGPSERGSALPFGGGLVALARDRVRREESPQVATESDLRFPLLASLTSHLIRTSWALPATFSSARRPASATNDNEEQTSVQVDSKAARPLLWPASFRMSNAGGCPSVVVVVAIPSAFRTEDLGRKATSRTFEYPSIVTSALHETSILVNPAQTKLQFRQIQRRINRRNCNVGKFRADETAIGPPAGPNPRPLFAQASLLQAMSQRVGGYIRRA
eukprot:7862517-Pyramimonas_sp.AAC.1